MKRMFALLMGLLVLGGMMGMVSAFTPTIDGNDSDWGSLDLLLLDPNSWNTPSSLQEKGLDSQHLQYIWMDTSGDAIDSVDAADVKYIRVTANSSYVYFYIKFTGQLTLGGKNPNAQNIPAVAIIIDSTDGGNKTFGGQVLWGADVKVSDSDPYAWDYLIRVDLNQFSTGGTYDNPAGVDVLDIYGDNVLYDDSNNLVYGDYSIGIYTGDTTTGGGIELKIPKGALGLSDQQFGFYMDFLTVLQTANSGSVQVEDAMDPLSSGSNTLSNFQYADITQVPFFSDSIAMGAVAILLALGAFWFFRRQ
ncbi:glucodextranase DOMON-like domain-containing protein [Thermococcus pacificus]|uniref:Uncharacterized protein n=1 Tax=Thermococcus pacificus TaxID=71998 RepID=A0A218P6G0_9EURY|nr:glucodextranase DOMON-like domain-containing protein [Thermococcus pacificus]ASJ06373.1 hypothetical protein A3L08_03010 [Thermococcus pacificus]